MAVATNARMSFDVLAPHYRWMEFVLAGEKLHRCRTAFLDEIPASKTILLLGEGHGRALIECALRFPNAEIICVDASKSMLTQAQGRLNRHNLASARVKFIRADILNWLPASNSYDLIVTNFFLDCFRPEQLEQIISRLATCASPDADWLIADFQNAPAGLRRIRSRLILWSMYAFFRAVTRLPARELTPPDSFLKRAGFVLHRRIQSEWGLLRSDWWRAVRS